MRHNNLGLLAAITTLGWVPNISLAQIRPPPVEDGIWYFCPASQFYYPWVQACVSAWQAQKAPDGADLPPMPPAPAWTSSMGSYGLNMYQKGLDDELVKYRDEQQKARIAKQNAIQYAKESAEANRKRQADIQHGFRYISLDDLELDKESIRDSQKLIVKGYYQLIGNEDWLYSNPENDGAPKIPLVVQNAPREVRAIIQRCRITHTCAISLVGNLGNCEHTFVGQSYRQDRCLYVTGTK